MGNELQPPGTLHIDRQDCLFAFNINSLSLRACTMQLTPPSLALAAERVMRASDVLCGVIAFFVIVFAAAKASAAKTGLFLWVSVFTVCSPEEEAASSSSRNTISDGAARARANSGRAAARA